MKRHSAAIEGFRVALQMEMRGESLYQRAQQFIQDEKFLEFLREMEREEQEHKAVFEAMLRQYEAPLETQEETLLLSSRAADFFFPGGLMQVAMRGAFERREAFLMEAIEAERNAISFFQSLCQKVEGEAYDAIWRIVEEEKRHLDQLLARQSMKEGIRMIMRTTMGKLPSGKEVEKFTLKNANGAQAEISALGGCILSIVVPDKDGKMGDVTLGYDSLPEMQSAGGYMGYLIGRFANRIGGASFELNGKTYTLAKNNGENSLHGGNEGFDKKIWDAQVDGDKLILSIVSPDGEEGYPGTLSLRVTYELSNDNSLSIDYEATCDQDTVQNLTNHVYFNLSGPACETIEDHMIQINASAITEVADSQCIPTGRILPVEGTPLDLRQMRKIGEGLSHEAECEQMQHGSGYDHNYVIDGWDGTLRLASIVEDAKSGRRMETWTDQPGVQFYSGNMIAGDDKGKMGVPYKRRQGFCLETQYYPDCVHHENFPSCVLKKGETFKTRTEYRFLVK